MRKGTDYVVDGFRYPDQIESFQEKGDFYLAFISASSDARFMRNMDRRREGDPVDFEEFHIADRRDRFGYLSGDGQNTDGCYNLADWRIENDGTLEELRRAARRVLNLVREDEVYEAVLSE